MFAASLPTTRMCTIKERHFHTVAGALDELLTAVRDMDGLAVTALLFFRSGPGSVIGFNVACVMCFSASRFFHQVTQVFFPSLQYQHMI